MYELLLATDEGLLELIVVDSEGRTLQETPISVEEAQSIDGKTVEPLEAGVILLDVPLRDEVLSNEERLLFSLTSANGCRSLNRPSSSLCLPDMVVALLLY